MRTETARPGRQRTADAVATLQATGADAWVATASAAGTAHLVPLSFAWDGETVTLAAQASSLTARNLQASRRARLGFGPTRDVVLVDATLERVVDAHDREAAGIAAAYAGQADWDPRQESESYLFLVLRPSRVQAWREANELEGRLIMRDGEWLASGDETRPDA